VLPVHLPCIYDIPSVAFMSSLCCLDCISTLCRLFINFRSLPFLSIRSLPVCPTFPLLPSPPSLPVCPTFARERQNSRQAASREVGSRKLLRGICCLKYLTAASHHILHANLPHAGTVQHARSLKHGFTVYSGPSHVVCEDPLSPHTKHNQAKVTVALPVSSALTQHGVKTAGPEQDGSDPSSMYF
jgi:hypothetical protein